MSFEPFDKSTFEDFLREANTKPDYTTNASSYYKDLARKNHLIELLSKKIWDYDIELAKRFEAWDKNLEEFDEEVLELLREWINDGTFNDIINEEIFALLNGKINDYIGDHIGSYDINIDGSLETDEAITENTNKFKLAMVNSKRLFIPPHAVIQLNDTIDIKIDGLEELYSSSQTYDTNPVLLFTLDDNKDALSFRGRKAFKGLTIDCQGTGRDGFVIKKGDSVSVENMEIRHTFRDSFVVRSEQDNDWVENLIVNRLMLRFSGRDAFHFSSMHYATYLNESQFNMVEVRAISQKQGNGHFIYAKTNAEHFGYSGCKMGNILFENFNADARRLDPSVVGWDIADNMIYFDGGSFENWSFHLGGWESLGGNGPKLQTETVYATDGTQTLKMKFNGIILYNWTNGGTHNIDFIGSFNHWRETVYPQYNLDVDGKLLAERRENITYFRDSTRIISKVVVTQTTGTVTTQIKIPYDFNKLVSTSTGRLVALVDLKAYTNTFRNFTNWSFKNYQLVIHATPETANVEGILLNSTGDDLKIVLSSFDYDRVSKELIINAEFTDIGLSGGENFVYFVADFSSDIRENAHYTQTV